MFTLKLVDDVPWYKLFLFLAAALASTILLKYSEIQYLEYLYAGALVILLRRFARQGFVMQCSSTIFYLGLLWMGFFPAAIALGAASLRYQFYFPGPIPFLRQPFIFTIARALEVFASVFFMLYFADQIRRSEWVGRYMMRIYFLVGVASALYSILSLPLSIAGIADLGTSNGDHRMRGFYNEGGPYGLYLLSLFVVGVALYQKGWETRKRLYGMFATLAIAFLGSQSKAAIAAGLALMSINLLITGSMRRRLVLLLGVVAFLIVTSRVVDLNRALRAYRNVRAEYERVSHYHAGDPNFVLGRVAGLFIVPRMVAEHPLTGIGWGNYGILRNAPEYRGASAWTSIGDDPGLGLLGLAADFGLPLLTYLLICLFTPAAIARAHKGSSYLVNLALLQPIAHLFGAQLNLTYPWIVTAFALGLSASRTDPSSQPAEVTSSSPALLLTARH